MYWAPLPESSVTVTQHKDVISNCPTHVSVTTRVPMSQGHLPGHDVLEWTALGERVTQPRHQERDSSILVLPQIRPGNRSFVVASLRTDHVSAFTRHRTSSVGYPLFP